jgi:hypothetical protein
MSDRGNALADTYNAVLNRARDLRSRKKYFLAYRVFRDAQASAMTILFLRRMDMLEDLDFADVRKIHSIAGVAATESREVRQELKDSGFDMSGKKKVSFNPEEDDDLYAILSEVSGGPLEDVT